MADRGASASVLTEISAQKNRPIHLIKAALAAGTLYMTDAYRPVIFDGNTYTALGHVLSFDGLEETGEVQTTTVTVTLSGIDQVWVANVLNGGYIDRELTIWKGFFDSADLLIVDPIKLFVGLMDAPEIAEDPESGSCMVTVQANSRGANFERRPGRHTNNEEQQLLYPGDGCFKHTADINKSVLWGGLFEVMPQTPGSDYALWPPDNGGDSGGGPA